MMSTVKESATDAWDTDGGAVGMRARPGSHVAATAHSGYERVFVILRCNTTNRQAETAAATVDLVKAVWTEEAADAEVARLNRSGGARGSTYSWKATRLESRAPSGT